MKHGFFSRLASRHPFGRWFPVLLAVMQLVAPLWHVCEMGGRCGECRSVNSAPVCHVSVKENNSPTPKCARCKPVTGMHAADTDSRGGFKATCLARELMSMGRVAVAPLQLDFQITRVRAPQSRHTPRRTLFNPPLPPSRGPPQPFVA
jgi:hypothetical protein